MNKLDDIRRRAALRQLDEAATRLHKSQTRSTTDKSHPARPKIVAVDFDGTICRSHDDGSMGEPLPGVRAKLYLLREAGWKIVIWTVRADSPELREHLRRWEIPHDYINSHPWQPPDSSHKIIADVYIDDRALRFDGVPSTFDEITSTKPWWKRG